MRKIAIAVLSLFFLLAILAGILQSPWGKESAVSLLKEALSDSGLQVEIGEIKGTLPHQIELKKLKIEAGGYEIACESLEVRIGQTVEYRWLSDVDDKPGGGWSPADKVGDTFEIELRAAQSFTAKLVAEHADWPNALTRD